MKTCKLCINVEKNISLIPDSTIKSVLRSSKVILNPSNVRSRPQSYQMVETCQLKFGSSLTCAMEITVFRFPPLAGWRLMWSSVLPTFLMMPLLLWMLVEFPVLIKDLPSKVGSFHCLLVPAVCLTRFCPDPYWWTVSAAWKIMEALVFPSTCGAPCCGRSRLGTSTFEWLRPPRSAVIMGKHWHFTGLMTLWNMDVWGVCHRIRTCRQSCSTQLWRGSVGHRIWRTWSRLWGCSMCLTNLNLHVSDGMLVMTSWPFQQHAKPEPSRALRCCGVFPPFHFPGRSMPVPCPRTASLSWQEISSQGRKYLVKDPLWSTMLTRL